MHDALGAMNDRMIESVAQRFRVLGEPQRLRILQGLEAGPKTVSEVVDLVGASQPNVSRHLQALYEAGLVERKRDGNNAVYSIADPLVFRLCDLVCRSVAAQARAGLAEMVTGPRAVVGSRARRRTSGAR